MIRKVSGSAIYIGDESFSQPIALTQDAVIGDWHDLDIDALNYEHFAALVATQPELVVLGTGSESAFAPKQLVFAFARAGIGLEVMNTPAAARTFNVLAGEGRRIAAVLYP
ncbi:MAG: MTH938/NDUFAF3 family protein [Woeseiaceae bacterium]|nr:MTH938/NDUFAF3 family protein [Woeseiaceae bacterium]